MDVITRLQEQSRMMEEQEKEIRKYKKALENCAETCETYYFKMMEPRCQQVGTLRVVRERAAKLGTSEYWLELEEE
jgi:hypothetical protein